jgi:aspartyl/asparaginyl-tRNA synthetase
MDQGNQRMNLETFEIDYELLAKAKVFYSARGYTYVEVPWIVEPRASLLTTTNEKVFITTKDEHFIGSSEQSFLDLSLKNELIPNTRYFSISPCFRRDVPDESHSRWFMKLELYSFYHHGMYEFNCKTYESFVDHAYDLFFREVPWLKKKYLAIVSTSESTVDINLNDIEIGSYGIRRFNDFTAVYGTGLALPRFSYALSTV